MEDPEMKKQEMQSRIISDSLAKASLYTHEKEYGKAFAYYLLHLEMSPTSACELKEQFLHVLVEWTQTLTQQRWISEVITVYTHAVRFYPDDFKLITDFAVFSLKHNHLSKARDLFERALELNRDDLQAEKNLFACKERAVERWHFKMLNDKRRNEAYKRALSTPSLKRKRVLDIGSGCGLLSIYAAAQSSVVAVEESEIQVKISEEVIKRNRGGHFIDLINKHSSEVYAEENSRAHVLVTEIFDTGLFGEHVVPTLLFAWNNLLEKDAQVIPCRADIFITGINSAELMERQVVLPENPLFTLGDVPMFVTERIYEPYDSEYINDFEDVVYLTHTHKISVDFSDVHQLNRIYNSLEDPFDEFDYGVVKSGVLHALVFWFDLYLTEDIKISTDPNSSDCVDCWGQAVMSLNRPLAIKEGDKIRITHSCDSSKFTSELKDDCYKDGAKFMQVTSMKVAFLNDKILCNALKLVLEKLGSANLAQRVIVDITSTPLLGLFANKFFAAECFCLCYEDKPFIEKLCIENKVDMARVNLCKTDMMLRLLRQNTVADFVVMEPVTSKGLLNDEQFRIYKVLKVSLAPNGVIIPQKVTMFVELIESEHVELSTELNDANLCGVKAAEVVNYYKVPEVCDIDAKKYPMRKLSAPTPTVNVMRDDSEPCVSQHEINVTQNGQAIGVLYWFEINYCYDVAVRTVDTNCYRSAIYLFDQKICVNVNDRLTICVKQHTGLLKVSLNQ